jgi:phosphatidate cytidylyltransferase
MSVDGDNSPRRSSPWLRYLQTGIVPRVLVIAVSAPCLFIITWRGGIFFLLLIDLIILLGLREFYQLLAAKGYRPYKVLGIGCGLAITWYVYWGGEAISLFLTLTLLLIMIRELFRRDRAHSLHHIATTVLGVLYVGWLASHLIMLRGLPDAVGVVEPRVVAGYGNLGARLVFFVAAVTWAGDVAAYMVGVAFGSRPLLPQVSPHKTIEGALGGLLGSAAAGLLCAGPLVPLTSLAGVLVGLSGGVLGQLGDLTESLLKRDVGIKDTAGLIPGHGGVLDRFDSLLFSGPLLYYYFRFFVV